MKRRNFLVNGSIFSLGLLSGVGTHAWAVKTNTPANRKRLIVVFLRGAVDGLSVVVPHRDPAYYQVRPQIAIAPPNQTDGVLNLDGNFGLHPALSPLMPLWENKTMAFIHACGSPDPTRSHFDAQNYMETGTPGVKRTTDGWMNRVMAALSGYSPIQAVSLGNNTPRILSGKIAIANLPTGRKATRPMVIDRPPIAQAFDQMYSGSDRLSMAYQEGRAARTEIMKNLQAEMDTANNGAPLPKGFSGDAQRLAKLMAQDDRIQIGFIALGGWDTHVNQGAATGQLARRLGQLGNGLNALVAGLGSVYRDTTILVISEFGRTVAENGNLGTDHGHGNVMWVLGGNIKGGQVYGDFPGLGTDVLYKGRDLAITTDFRDPISTVLEQHLRLNDSQLAQIFPGYQPKNQIPLFG